jgi:hypothetical protein
MLLLISFGALALILMLMRGPAAEAQPALTPDFEVLDESRGDHVRELVVATAARDEDEMRLVTEELSEKRPAPDDGMLLVEFRDNPATGETAGRYGLRETGFALAFDSERAALADDLRYSPDEARGIMQEEGGIRVVSFRDFDEQNPDLADDLEGILR